MRYSYFCAQCGAEDIDEICLPIGHTAPFPCRLCGGQMQRGVCFAIRRSMPEHFNVSTGQYVSNERSFADQLKIKSEEASLRTGMDHSFVPVDITDMKALGVTDEGLEHTHRIHHDQGLVHG